MRLLMELFLLTVAAWQGRQVANGFVVTPRFVVIRPQEQVLPQARTVGGVFSTTGRSSSLLAKKSRNSSTTKRGKEGGGGFATASAVSKKSTVHQSNLLDNNNDYKVFPRLEQQVLDTIIPGYDSSPVSELPDEIYQRLDQIYGLPNFNFASEPTASNDDASAAAFSFHDLLSQSTPIQTSSKISDLLANNLATEPTTAASESLPFSSKLAVELLPPFSKLRVLHVDPLVVGVDEFFTPEECDRYIAMSTATEDNNNHDTNDNEVLQRRSPTVGKDANAMAQRTSTTWYHNYANVPELMAKVSRLLGLKTIDHWEEPQIVRYRRSEKFTWHLDALGPNENKPHLGGQRIATFLVYLTDLTDQEGGATIFRDLQSMGAAGPLRVCPKKGSALLFFPAAGGIPNAPCDFRTLHCGEVVADHAVNDKWISQLWLREGVYHPTAPPGNEHDKATLAIADYCATMSQQQLAAANQ